MKNTQQNLRSIVHILMKNASRMGLDDLMLQNMIQTALDSKSGLLVEVCHKKDKACRISENGKCKFFHLMPHHPLPNSVEYKRKKSRLDPLSGLFGILRREDTGQDTVRNHRNIRANGFVKYMMNYMGHLRDKGKNYSYWKVGMKLLESDVFQAMAFNYVCSGWQGNMTAAQVNEILAGVKTIIATQRTEIQLRRVYIPKANGKIRPLGVPNKSWRIYLHMMNILIVWFRTGTDKRQHAYFPGRGVHTAWLALLQKLGEENIYEFDLTNFFPSVNLRANERIMREVYGIPEKISRQLHLLTRSITRLSKEDLIDESSDRNVLLTSEGEANPNLPEEIRNLINELLSDMTAHRKRWLISSTAFQDVLPSGWTVFKEVGVPQGAAISCGLSTLNLHYLFEKYQDALLMYADDGLVFPKESENPNLTDTARGISQNDSKSGWVKRDGKWQKPLKFLGLEYIPSTGDTPAKLRAKTRNGSTKEFGLDRQLLVSLLNEKELMMWVQEENQNKNGPETVAKEVGDHTGIMHKLWSPKLRADVLINKLFTSARAAKCEIRFPPDEAGFQVHNLGYGSQKKVSRECLSTLELNRSTCESVIKDFDVNSLSSWLSNAATRLASHPNPLTLLFEGRGLTELANLYSLKDKELPTTELVGKRRSWLWTHLGSCLYTDWWNEFYRTHDISEKEIGESKSFEVWRSLFKLREKANTSEAKGMDKPSTSSGVSSKENSTDTSEAKGMGKPSTSTSIYGDLVLACLRKEMVRYIREIGISIHNVSTIAICHLLENKLKLPEPEEVLHSYVVKPLERKVKSEEDKALELRQRNKKYLRRLEKEFKSTYGCWPRKLSRIPNDLSSVVSLEENSLSKVD